MMTRRRQFFVLPLLLAFISFGCGGGGNPNSPAKINGRITYNGSPVTAGFIAFHTPEGTAYAIGIRPDGTYLITDVPTGELFVTIETESANPSKKTPDYGTGSSGPGKFAAGKSPAGKGPTGSPMPENAKTAPTGTYVKIPAKYSGKATSGLTATIVSGSQVKDFALTD